MKELEVAIGLKEGTIIDFIVNMGGKLILAVVIFVVGFWLAKVLSKALEKMLRKGKSDEGLISFLSSLTKIVLKVLVIITAITQLGVEMTSFVALLGAAGLAIGMAFSGTLSNFAGGVMILIFKPFKVGDLIETDSKLGVVDSISIFNTYLKTMDNRAIILPNGPVANNTIVNFTREEIRRVDWSFGIAYGDNLLVAKNTLTKFIEEDPRILKDPEPLVALGALADSSVDITARGWVKTDDYWDVFFAMNERVYNEFGKEGLNFPFPQMDVHLKQQN